MSKTTINTMQNAFFLKKVLQKVFQKVVQKVLQFETKENVNIEKKITKRRVPAFCVVVFAGGVA